MLSFQRLRLRTCILSWAVQHPWDRAELKAAKMEQAAVTSYLAAGFPSSLFPFSFPCQFFSSEKVREASGGSGPAAPGPRCGDGSPGAEPSGSALPAGVLTPGEHNPPHAPCASRRSWGVQLVRHGGDGSVGSSCCPDRGWAGWSG